MYVPRHWHWLGPFAFILLGFYIHENLNSAWDVIVFINIPLAILAMEWGAYILQAGVAYQNYLTGAPSPRRVERPLPDLGSDFVPLVRPMSNDNAQTVDVPKFDSERQVARTVINQRNHNLKVDLTEEFWIKRGNFEGSREAFVAVMDKWKRYKLIRKGEQTNSTHEVMDWRGIRLIADGHPLPD